MREARLRIAAEWKPEECRRARSYGPMAGYRWIN